MSHRVIFLVLSLLVAISIAMGLGSQQNASQNKTLISANMDRAGVNMSSNPSLPGIDETKILGIVRNGKFIPLENRSDISSPLRLTSIRIMEARTPESGELNLTAYEGAVIMVSGRPNGDWLFSSAVIDHAGPILTAVALKAFGQEEENSS